MQPIKKNVSWKFKPEKLLSVLLGCGATYMSTYE